MSTEKRDLLAEEHGWDKIPDPLGAAARTSYRASFKLGWDAATKEVDWVWDQRDEFNVKYQEAQGRIEELELTVKRLEGAVLLGISEMERVQKEILQVRKTYPGIMTPTMNEYSIAPLREALSREGKGET